MFPASEQHILKDETLEELRGISDSIRNIAGCLPHCSDHDSIKETFDDLCSIWFDLEKILRKEEKRSPYMEEEIRKFTEGFAYQPRPCGECCC